MSSEHVLCRRLPVCNLMANCATPFLSRDFCRRLLYIGRWMLYRACVIFIAGTPPQCTLRGMVITATKDAMNLPRFICLLICWLFESCGLIFKTFYLLKHTVYFNESSGHFRSHFIIGKHAILTLLRAHDFRGYIEWDKTPPQQIPLRQNPLYDKTPLRQLPPYNKTPIPYFLNTNGKWRSKHVLLITNRQNGDIHVGD